MATTKYEISEMDSQNETRRRRLECRRVAYRQSMQNESLKDSEHSTCKDELRQLT